jgi:hypothetical protein
MEAFEAIEPSSDNRWRLITYSLSFRLTSFTTEKINWLDSRKKEGRTETEKAYLDTPPSSNPGIPFIVPTPPYCRTPHMCEP